MHKCFANLIVEIIRNLVYNDKEKLSAIIKVKLDKVLQ